jgi:hypothetical protein
MTLWSRGYPTPAFYYPRPLVLATDGTEAPYRRNAHGADWAHSRKMNRRSSAPENVALVAADEMKRRFRTSCNDPTMWVTHAEPSALASSWSARATEPPTFVS